MKKILGTLLISVAVIGGTSVASASDIVAEKNYHTTEIVNGETVEVEGYEATFQEQPESTSEFILYATAGTRTAKVEAKKPLFSEYYALASSTATYKHNTIGSKVRVFKSDGRSLGTNSNSASNSTISTATVYPGNIGTGSYAIGNHTFKRSGFKDTFPETKKNF